MPGRTKWFKRRIDSEIEVRLMLLTMREKKATGTVVVYSCRKMPYKIDELISFLNGNGDLQLIRGFAFSEGIIVNRLSKKSGFDLKNAWFFPEIHPSQKHASWIYFIDNNMDAKELVVRAPDPRALHIAFKLAGLKTDQDGVEMTADIAKYVWNYAHNIMLEGRDAF